MDLSRTFHRRMTARFLQAMALTLPPVALIAGADAGCSAPGSGGAPYAAEACIQWPPPGSASGTGGGTGTSPCPAAADALMFIDNQECGVTQVKSGPTVPQTGQCCYQVIKQTCGLVGRPFLVDGAPRAAAPARHHGAGWIDDGALAPRTDDLPAATRARLAEAWARDGLFEHASVASFGRFALELLAVGAPSDLIEAAHRAALDEVRHARLCLGLASAYAGAPIAPAPFPFDGRVEVSADLADLAARAAREGCVGETLAAALAMEQLGRAEDPAVRAALAIIAEDEARHAELGWRTVAWAIRAGGEPVRASVREAFAEAMRGAVAAFDAEPCDAVMNAHGRLGGSAARGALVRALDQVVRPCAAALTSVSPPGYSASESASTPAAVTR